MDIENYFKNLTTELESLKDRVRLYIEDAHWQSDGEWKESVLRTVLKRHLPQNIGVGRGFIVNVEYASTQIDILLYDNSKPILFQDGDFVIITPDTAKGVIEVKTKLWQQGDLRNAINKISEIAQFINSTNAYGKDQFFGLFSYEDAEFNTDSVLGILQECVNGQRQRIVNCISIGSNYFVRFWPNRLFGQFPKWHSYQLENKAPAYFIHNVIDHLYPKWTSDNNDVWYPENGKENYQIGEIDLPLPHQITD
ncbi:MAG: hypothetical protein JXQ25_06135 [Deltaproteobacteria bacterium]|mgnify:CR=1 FL=1|nr:hypothetical protein [Deltaproteobacteria bacterium]